MTDLLGPWKDEGRWDSEGSFTIDPARALQKLKAHALAEPRRYILGLISWAVAGQARSIDVMTKAGRLEVAVSGLPLCEDDLRGLFSETGLSGVSSRELAIATITASGLPRARVTLCGHQARLVVDAKGFAIEAAEGGPTTLWRLDEPKSMLGWVGRALGDVGLEVPLLRELCGHSEVPIKVNGTPIFRPIDLPRIRRAIHLHGPPLPLEPEQLAGNHIEVRPSPGNFSALVAASTTPILRTKALYLVHGVSFEMPPVEVYGENFAVVVNAPSLTKDLSSRSLVVNQECEKIQATVDKLAHELWKSMGSKD
jgi:hypothetical protein